MASSTRSILDNIAKLGPMRDPSPHYDYTWTPTKETETPAASTTPVAVNPNSYVGARSIEELAAALSKLSYTPRTEAQRREQSESLYRNQLEQALLSAQQQYDTSDLALANQLVGLDTATARQIEAQRQNTAQAISQADRRALSRGMQRSTYNNSVLANLQLKGNEAEAQIQQNRTDTENQVAAQRALLASQLAQNQTAAQSQFQNSVIASMQQMEDQDYQRQLAADQFNSNTQLQLYQAQQTDAQRAQQQAQFEAGQQLTREQMNQNQTQFNLNLQLQRDELAEKIRQFNEELALKQAAAAASRSSGSGGSSGNGNTTNNPGNNPGSNPGRNYDDLNTKNPITAVNVSTQQILQNHGTPTAVSYVNGKPVISTLPAGLTVPTTQTTQTAKLPTSSVPPLMRPAAPTKIKNSAR